jgi:uncharacterized protein with gpF-like domain
MARNRLITGLTRARELAQQTALRTRIEARGESAWRKEIMTTMMAYAKQADGAKDYGSVTLAHETRVRKLVEREWRVCFDVFGRRILDAAKKSSAAVRSTKASVQRTAQYDKAVTDWVRTYGAVKVTEISGTTATQAMRIINDATAAGIAAGENEVAVGRAIMQQMREAGSPISQLRARMIARTEAHTASTAATHEAAIALDFPTRKEWIASKDDRTRESHRLADGTTVQMGEAFVVEGESLQYPGDPSGSAANTVNCRCIEGIVI